MYHDARIHERQPYPALSIVDIMCVNISFVEETWILLNYNF